MSEEQKPKGRATKSDLINRAVERGLATEAELQDLSYNDISKILKGKKVEEAEAKPRCDHEYHKVRVVSIDGNYVTMRCRKCWAEKEV